MAAAWQGAVISGAILSCLACQTAATSTAGSEPELAGPAWIHAEQRLFIQEYWEQGKPYYLIANLRPTVAVISASADHSPGAGPSLGPVTIPAHSSVTAPATYVAGPPGATFGFRLADGTQLGSLHAPVQSPMPANGERIYQAGLNGIGAAADWSGVAAGAPLAPLNAGSESNVDLILAKGAGDVIFANHSAGEAPELAQLIVQNVTCKGLTVAKNGDKTTIVNPADGSGPDPTRTFKCQVAVHVPTGSIAPLAELHAQLKVTGWSTPLTYGFALND